VSTAAARTHVPASTAPLSEGTLQPARNSQPPLHIVRRSERRVEIDITRGLLILLMISSHSIGLTEVPPTSFFRSALWLPRGWAATSFLFLTGVTAAIAVASNRRWIDGMRRRAGRLLAVMLASNLIFLVCKFALGGELLKLTDPSRWPALLTLQTDSTISAIMLPSILVLAAVPWLLTLQQRLSDVVFAGLSALLFAGAWTLRWTGAPSAFSGNHVFATLFVGGVGGFPIVPLVANGILGFVFGKIWLRWAPAIDRGPRVAPPLAMAVLIGTVCSLPSAAVVQATLGSVLRFSIVLMAATTIATLMARRGRDYLALLGQFGVFAFIVHRPIIQAALRFSAPLSVTTSQRYAMVAMATLGGVGVLCVLRRRYARFDRVFRAMYL
jgi:hypothetical protein